MGRKAGMGRKPLSGSVILNWLQDTVLLDSGHGLDSWLPASVGEVELLDLVVVVVVVVQQAAGLVVVPVGNATPPERCRNLCI